MEFALKNVVALSLSFFFLQSIVGYKNENERSNRGLKNKKNFKN